MAKTFPCPQCDRVFDSLNARSGHITGKHRNSEREWRCDECGEVYSGPGPLGNHYKNKHNGEAPVPTRTVPPRGRFFPCSECERVFTTKSGRTHHFTVMHEMEPDVGPREPDEPPQTIDIDLTAEPVDGVMLVHVPEEAEAGNVDHEFPDPAEIVAAVSQQLWRDKTMPLAAVRALLDWYDQTGMFIERISAES